MGPGRGCGWVAAIVMLVMAAACATPGRLPAVPADQTARAEAPVSDARFWPDRDVTPYVTILEHALRREQALLAQQGHRGPLPPAYFLAVSGGGDDGAFGAGLLVGWTEHGDRPEFKVVTGVSTGALIAPFAFLGPRYDPVLREVYTQISQKDIFKTRNFTAALFNDAMADTSPLAALVKRHVTPEFLSEIAAEYAKGRLLLVGTTNLDARVPVVWNMTAIAASGDPDALDLFRRIMVASASIPGAFPPVMIDVDVDGRRYQEMHVDGGATRQVFLYPPQLQAGALSREYHAGRKRGVYLIRNARLDPDWASVDRRTLSIANRSVSSLIATQGVGDLDRLYMTATRDGIDYNLAFIPPTFTTPHKSEFDTHYMRELFETGRSLAAAGYRWQKFPPGFAPAP
ncbi:patatin-like phospholipase family protein [Phenylobacterium sp. LjRoot219]|uniref:patatin-like phospholipase family protein n=1 Tax=Phenylobacterium sp. LjRoot219 TaxID=3342283 RepID=UPI003ECE4976